MNMCLKRLEGGKLTPFTLKGRSLQFWTHIFWLIFACVPSVPLIGPYLGKRRGGTVFYSGRIESLAPESHALETLTHCVVSVMCGPPRRQAGVMFSSPMRRRSPDRSVGGDVDGDVGAGCHGALADGRGVERLVQLVFCTWSSVPDLRHLLG
jgi:hypothetical protein